MKKCIVNTIILIAMFFWLAGSASAASLNGTITNITNPDTQTYAGDNEEFPWTMFMPAILGGNKAVSVWGVVNFVCCSTSSATFSVTIKDEETKSSTLSSCSAEPTFAGYSEISPGPKSFDWSLSSATCGTMSGSFNFTFTANTVYLVALEFENNSLVITIYADAMQSDEEGIGGNSLQTTKDFMAGLVFDKTIQIPLTDSITDGSDAFRKCGKCE